MSKDVKKVPKISCDWNMCLKSVEIGKDALHLRLKGE